MRSHVPTARGSQRRRPESTPVDGARRSRLAGNATPWPPPTSDHTSTTNPGPWSHASPALAAPVRNPSRPEIPSSGPGNRALGTRTAPTPEAARPCHPPATGAETTPRCHSESTAAPASQGDSPKPWRCEKAVTSVERPTPDNFRATAATHCQLEAKTADRQTGSDWHGPSQGHHNSDYQTDRMAVIGTTDSAVV